MRHKHLYKCPTGVQRHSEMKVFLLGDWVILQTLSILRVPEVPIENNVQSWSCDKGKPNRQQFEPAACSQQGCMVLTVFQTKLKGSHHARRLALCNHTVNYWPGLTCTRLTCLFAGLWLLRHHPRRRFSLPVLTCSHTEDSLTSLQGAPPESCEWSVLTDQCRGVVAVFGIQISSEAG